MPENCTLEIRESESVLMTGETQWTDKLFLKNGKIVMRSHDFNNHVFQTESKIKTNEIQHWNIEYDQSEVKIIEIADTVEKMRK